MHGPIQAVKEVQPVKAGRWHSAWMAARMLVPLAWLTSHTELHPGAWHVDAEQGGLLSALDLWLRCGRPPRVSWRDTARCG